MVTSFLTHPTAINYLPILPGATLLAVDVLKAIPVAVLFGVFLYLGVMNMCNAQMLHRSILFFVPVKYHPSNAVYCLRVSWVFI